MEKYLRGKVILAGAGPGDPELITLKACQYLRKADVVLTDRLVSRQLLDQWVNKKAEIVYTGKQGGHEASVSQQTINQLLVKYALEDKLVVRLKGGDVSLFSNILDELRTLVKHEIPYEIIPGITAALGAAAYAGIPLTAREHASAVRILTFHEPESFSERLWQELADTGDTLVFYMSTRNLDVLIRQLTRHRIAPDKLLAVIEQATTARQRIVVRSLYAPPETQEVYASPSLVIIGKVAGLHEQFAWLNRQYCGDLSFTAPDTEIFSSHPQTHAHAG